MSAVTHPTVSEFICSGWKQTANLPRSKSLPQRIFLPAAYPQPILPGFRLIPPRHVCMPPMKSATFNNTPTGAVSAFSVNQSNGELTFLNTVSSQGGGPAHLSVDPSGRNVLVSNYGGGNCAVLPILCRRIPRRGYGRRDGRGHLFTQSMPCWTQHGREGASRQFRQKRARQRPMPT